MPKQKTHSGAKKRFKVTGGGKDHEAEANHAPQLRGQVVARAPRRLSHENESRPRATPRSPRSSSASLSADARIGINRNGKQSSGPSTPTRSVASSSSAPPATGASARACTARRRSRSPTRSSTRTATVSKRKGDFRRLWIQRINAAARQNGITYNRFIQGLGLAGVQVDRRMLAELAVNEPATFASPRRDRQEGAAPTRQRSQERLPRSSVSVEGRPPHGGRPSQRRPGTCPSEPTLN